MKKLIIACLAAVLVSLSACSTVDENKTASTPSTTNKAVQPTVPFPDSPTTTTPDQIKLPKPAGYP